MESLSYLNPINIIEGVREGTIADKVDKRILSALVVLFGLKVAKKLLLSPMYSFYKYFLRPQKDLFTRYGGGWVVVTGASDGIGLGY